MITILNNPNTLNMSLRMSRLIFEFKLAVLSILNTLHKSHMFNHQRMGHYLVILPIMLNIPSTLLHYPIAQMNFEGH